MNRKLVLLLLVPMVSLLLCLFCGYQLLAKRCLLWTCVPDRSFALLDLEVPLHFFPENAEWYPMRNLSREELAIESGIMSVYWNENSVRHSFLFTANRFGTEFQATRSYESSVYYWNRGMFYDHPDLTFQSQMANEYLLGCGVSTFGGMSQCRYLARYQEYVLAISAGISDAMTVSQFEQIVVHIDMMMTDFIEVEYR